MYNLLLQFDPSVLTEKLAAHPGAYARLLNALCKLTQGCLHYQRRHTD